MPRLNQWLKRQSEIIAAVCILGGFLAGLITAFGGHIPPWFTPAEAETLAQQQAAIATILQQQSGVLERLSRKFDRQDCDDANESLARALTALKMHPNDQLAIGLTKAAKKQIEQIDGCVPEPNR